MTICGFKSRLQILGGGEGWGNLCFPGKREPLLGHPLVPVSTALSSWNQLHWPVPSPPENNGLSQGPLQFSMWSGTVKGQEQIPLGESSPPFLWPSHIFHGCFVTVGSLCFIFITTDGRGKAGIFNLTFREGTVSFLKSRYNYG